MVRRMRRKATAALQPGGARLQSRSNPLVPLDPASAPPLPQGRALLRRPRGCWVKLWAVYYGEHSPLDGYARAVLNGLTLMAQPWASRHGQDGGSSLCELDQPLQNRTQNARLHTRFAVGFAHFAARDWQAIDAETDSDVNAFVYAAAAVRWPDSAACTLAEITRFVGLPRGRVQRALQSLLNIGEAYLSVDGAYVLAHYWHSQETPSSRSKRASRAAARAVDSQHLNGSDSHADFHADNPRDSRADSREDLPVSYSTEQRRVNQSRSAAAIALPLEPSAEIVGRESLPPPPQQRLAANSRTQASSSGGASLETETATLEQAGTSLSAELASHMPEQSMSLTPQRGSEGEERAAVLTGHRWLNEIMLETTTQPAPSASGKWREGYRLLGERPASERATVEPVLRAELTSRRLRPHMCNPRHLLDYWLGYLSGEPPRGSPPRDSPPSAPAPAASRKEFEAEAARKPAWLTSVEV